MERKGPLMVDACSKCYGHDAQFNSLCVWCDRLRLVRELQHLTTKVSGLSKENEELREQFKITLMYLDSESSAEEAAKLMTKYFKAHSLLNKEEVEAAFKEADRVLAKYSKDKGE